MDTIDRAVLDAARSSDRDRYLAALLAPADARADLVVLAAYLGETRRIPLLAHDAAVGEIRLQWWRDALGADAPASGHPVADAVAGLARRHGLDRDLVLAPVEGASRELYEDGFADDERLDRYAAETGGAGLRLALLVLGCGEAALGVVPAGRALALTRLALTLPQHLALGRLPLPPAYLGGLSDPRGAAPAEARSATRALLSRLSEEALRALDAFRKEAAGLEPDARAAFLPLVLVEPYVKSVLAPRRDVLRDVADISPLSRVMRLWFAQVRGRI
ncbi:MAG: squalene/phytoene synthase family protein [Hyphomicrobium sp.]|uniref:squalene/phytoene synthase family protein n=1 Tax=Hyphomicrobium sp. TaxID=82 RepID=UPI003D0BBA3C